MTDYPHVVIGVLTYERLKELQITLDALLKYVQYPPDRLHWVISDDSSPSKDKKIATLTKKAAYQHMTFITTPQRSGWGANANFLMHYCMVHTPAHYMFFIEDDYVLTCPLDLRLGIGLLEKNKSIAMLRYRGTAGTEVFYRQLEANLAEYAPDTKPDPQFTTYLELLPTSNTLWIYSNGIHVKRLHGGFDENERYWAAFHEYFGQYPVGLSLGETEMKYAHTVKDRMPFGDAPKIAIFPEWIYMQFDHIGETFKETTHDIGVRK